MKVIEGFPFGKEGVSVGWDQCEVSTDKLYTDGIGSCLAITLYNSENRKGALAHVTGFQYSAFVPEEARPENIVNTMILRLGICGRLEAVLAGEDVPEQKMSPIVKKNLEFLQIPIIGEDLGSFDSYRGREVHFNCRTGEIYVYKIPS